MNHKQLFKICVEILDSFNANIHGVQEHVTAFLTKTKGLGESEALFLTEVFSGCVQFKDILKVVVDAYYADAGKTCLRVDRNVYTVLVYLALYRLDELGVAHFRKFIASHDSNKMHKFLVFFLDENNIKTWMEDEWCKQYELSYVQRNLISPLLRWIPELQEIVEKLADKLANKQKPLHPKSATELKPFKLTKPRPRSVPMPEKIPTLQKHRPAPKTTYKTPVEQDIISRLKEENRRKAEEQLIKAEARQFSCASAEKSAKTRRRMQDYIDEERSKLQFNKHKAMNLPSTTTGNMPIRLNAAAIMREGILFQKKEEEEIKKFEELVKGGRDDSEFLRWQEKKRAQDLEDKLAEIEKRRLEGRLSYEDAILARQMLIKENQERVKKIKEETREMMQLYMERRLKEGEEMRELVEQTMSDHKNAREAKRKLHEYKQKIVQEVNKESQEMMRQALEEAEEEMRQKVALIAKIRAIESVPVIRFKYVDLTETSGAGLLGEMSVSELRERLALLKVAAKEEEEKKRDDILKAKVEKDQLLMDTLETIAKHRAEKGKEAVIKQEVKKKTVKRDIKDPKVQELQEKLQARKTERLRESEKLSVIPKKDSNRRLKALQNQKRAIEEMRWRELEETRERTAKLRGVGLASRNSAGVRPVTTLQNDRTVARITS